MTIQSDDFSASAIDHVEMQAEPFRNLSAEEIEIVSGGFSWGDLLALLPVAAPTIASIL
jgi:phosphoribosylformylglycinamidine (FGAM) synthase-like amidotransferase family enzyme